MSCTLQKIGWYANYLVQEMNNTRARYLQTMGWYTSYICTDDGMERELHCTEDGMIHRLPRTDDGMVRELHSKEDGMVREQYFTGMGWYTSLDFITMSLRLHHPLSAPEF